MGRQLGCVRGRRGDGLRIGFTHRGLSFLRLAGTCVRVCNEAVGGRGPVGQPARTLHLLSLAVLPENVRTNAAVNTYVYCVATLG